MLSVSKVAKYLYCPRLFFYEVVEGLDIETDDMLEGKIQHQRRESKDKILLSSDKYGFCGVPDIVNDNGVVRLEEIKHGSGPKEGIWENDQIQITLYYLLLKEHDIEVESANVYYQKTKSKRILNIDEDLISKALDILQECEYLLRSKEIPALTLDSYKCEHCSMLQICQPDLKEKPKGWRFKKEIGEAVYINGYNYKLSIKGDTLEIIDINSDQKNKIPLEQVNSLNLFGTPQFSTQLIQRFLEDDKPISFFSANGYFLGITHSMFTLNQYIREKQYGSLKQQAIILTKQVVDAKIRNQHVILLRRGKELKDIKKLKKSLTEADNLDSIRGIEGIASKYYFEALGECIGNFDFENRNKRPPKDPVNALLSYGYTILCKDITVGLYKLGLDPMYGFFHVCEAGRPALALDLMEPFRPILVDSLVLTLINKKIIENNDFKQYSDGVFMKPEARKKFLVAYEARKKEEVTDTNLNRKLTYNEHIEATGRQLMRYLNGEIGDFGCLTIK